MNAPCQHCGAEFRKRKATRKFCSRRCSGLHQRQWQRETGEHIQRYWQSVERRADDECWPWLASTSAGYGQIRFAGEKLGAHVVAFMLHNGQVPGGKMVLHRCGNRLCCNPAHLYAGTHADNTNDAIRHGTYQTVFQPGHAPFRRRA